MGYNLFLFDLDDTLLDFTASEKLSFFLTMRNLGIQTNLDKMFYDYQIENRRLWKLFEEAKTTKDHLKVERFRQMFKFHKVDADPEAASSHYLESLPENVVLMDGAVDICDYLIRFGEIGIITNGMHTVQTKRLANSQLAPYISFVAVSEHCGFAKPDVRFFEYTSKMAKIFSKDSTLIIGDRAEADIQGALNFGIDSCWFNPLKNKSVFTPRYEIQHLSEIKTIVR